MRTVVFLLLYLVCSGSYSQIIESRIPTHKGLFIPRFEEIRSSGDDLTVSTINCITQTSDGYLWIGTRLGLVRYNGSSFLDINKIFRLPILERDVNTIVEDKNGIIWIGTGRGLISYKDNRVRLTEYEKFFDKIEVRSIKIDTYGTMWVATQKGLFKISNGNVTKIPEIKETLIFTLLIDSKNRIWIAESGYGIVLIDNGNFIRFNKKNGLTDETILSIFEDNKGNIWCGSTTGEITKYRNGYFEPVDEPTEQKNRSIQSFAIDKQNNIWIATTGQGLLRYKDGIFQRYTSKHGLSADAIKSVFIDKENNLWVGTSGAGLNKLRDYSISTYTIRDGLPNNAVYSIYQDAASRIWIATAGSGLCYLEKDKLKNIDASNAIDNKSIRSISDDGEGSIFLGTNGSGLFRFKYGKFLALLNQNTIKEKTVKALFKDSKGTVWIGTSSFCYYYKSGKFNIFLPEKENPRNVRAIVNDSKGNIWFGCGAHGVYKWNGNKLIHFGEKEGLKINDVLYLYVDKEDNVWIPTARGLSLIRNGKITNFQMEGLLSDLMFFCCVEDHFGDLWLSSNIGIVAVSKKELIEYADGSGKSFTTRYFGKDDGLLSTECNGGSQPCGLITDDGRVWFPTMNGIAIVDPEKIRTPKNVVPNVIIESLIVNDSSLALDKTIELPASDDRFEFHFSCLSLKNPLKNRYKYKLEGLNPDWIDAGNRNIVYYNNIPPGKYIFRVIAANSDGIWNMEGASINLNINPAFYQTIWFYIFTGLFCLGLGYTIYLYRMRSLEANKQNLSKLVEEKTSQLNKELSEREITQKELMASEERYKFVIEGSNEVFYDWQIQVNVVVYSSKWAELLETEYAQIEGATDSWDNALHPDDKEPVMFSLERHFKAETPFFEMEYRIITHKGNVRWIYDRGKVVLRDESDKPIRMSGTLHDITDRKRLEDEFLKMKKIESIGVLAGGIAHDFNNILTSILGNISLAKFKFENKDYGKIPELLTNSEKASFRAKDLTYQLLTFSKGGSPIIKTSSLKNLIIDACSFAAHGTNVVHDIDISDNIWLVDIDEGQISQVVQNIVINATQAMPNGGKIRLKAENYIHNSTLRSDLHLTNGEYVKVTISDEGIGIPKEVMEKIFDPYFSTKESGQGLGLATTYSIIKKHNGIITVESEISKGSTFIFYLPRSNGSTTYSQPERPVLSGNSRILVMDDDEMVRELLVEMLSGIGYDVATAENGTEAIKKYSESLSNNKFDCVIMDLTIPGDMGGKETIERLKQIDPEIKAIVSSGYSNDPIMSGYKQYGFAAVISKPFHIEDVSAILSSII